MSINFIPTVWAARLLTVLQQKLVYAQEGVVNRDYEGEIEKHGDIVKIGTLSAIQIGDYTKNTDMTIQTLSDAEQVLVIDQQKYFNFMVDALDKAQQNVNSLETGVEDAAYQLNKVADNFVASFYVNVPSGNLIGSDAVPIVPTSTTAYEKLIDLGTILDENDVPIDGRFAVVPPWYHALLLKDDRFVKYGGMQQESTLKNGQVGVAAGFSILKSNNVPNVAGAKYKIIAGHAVACSYAEQIVRIESYTAPNRFGDGVKGLHVYGAKLIRPSAWAVLTASKA